LGHDNKIINGTPVVTIRKPPRRTQSRSSGGNPIVSREHGLKGERDVVALLRREFSTRDGYQVEHVAAKDPTADQDISIVTGTFGVSPRQALDWSILPAMKIATGKVVGGKVIVEGVTLEEGTSVTVLAKDDEGGFTLSPEEEAELLLSIAEAD